MHARHFRAINSTVIFVLYLIINTLSESEYIIVPDQAADQCRNYVNKTCITLNQTIPDQECLNLNFAPGNYVLSQKLAFLNNTNVTLIGATPTNRSVIHCQPTGGFSFSHIGRLSIENLEFRGCTGVQSHGGAVFISNVDEALIRGCHFAHNTVLGFSVRGGAIYVEGSDKVTVEQSSFINNSCRFCSGSAVFITTSTNALIRQNQFIQNTGFSGGAIFIKSGTSALIHQNQFTRNTASYRGGAIAFEFSTVNVSNTVFQNNTALIGGAIDMLQGSFENCNSSYIGNLALQFGGSIFAGKSSITNLVTQFSQNSADLGGCIVALQSTVTEAECQYTLNKARFAGVVYGEEANYSSTHSNYTGNSANASAVQYVVNSTVANTNNYYTDNIAAVFGGVLLAEGSAVHNSENTYLRNSASLGGVIYTSNSTAIYNTHCHFAYNKAILAGVIYARQSMADVSTCTFTNNIATLFEGFDPATTRPKTVVGGAIIVDETHFTSSNSTYQNNQASYSGGAVYTLRSVTTITDDIFQHNHAREGAAIYSMQGETFISNTNLTSNQAVTNGILSLHSTRLTCKDNLFFRNNNGSLSIFNSRVEFQGEALFENNSGTSGGAITSQQSRITFEDTARVTIVGNTASYGAGLSLSESMLTVSCPAVVTENEAKVLGGGVYAVQSQVEIRLPQGTALIKDNKAGHNGGGFYATSSQLNIYNGLLQFNNNSANMQGGAIYLEKNSKIYLYKEEQETNNTIEKKVQLELVRNKATFGGALYVADQTNAGTLCRRTNSINLEPLVTIECFLQTIQFYVTLPLTAGNQLQPSVTTYSNVVFSNNTARGSGGDLYGGLLDRCSLNPQAELTDVLPLNAAIYNGFDYLKLLAEFSGLTDYSELIKRADYPLNIIHNISNTQVSSLITSDAVQVCFCKQGEMDCNYVPPSISVKKGEKFTVNVTAVDQVGNPVRANITGTAVSNSGVSRLKEGQASQTVQEHCTEIEYSVFAADDSAQIQLYAEGPCSDLGISLRTLNVTFTACTCPVGFEPLLSDIECTCQCDRRLAVSRCSFEDQTVHVERNVWIGTSSMTNVSRFVIQQCPFDYCVSKPVNISFTNEAAINEQCAYNRSGYLCGQCQDGLSLVFSTSRCLTCSSYSIFLLIPFALAGILLVVLIVVLNMTVAIGTINGLIFYANILSANHSIFLPFNNNPLTVFISWLNLDLGIETCFYHGMDSYGKLLLQMVFPVYIWLLMIVIIILSEYSSRFATLLGKRNPVAALCTLVLLSYSKLLRMIIEALQFTTLHFPNGSQTVWLLDANVPYSSATHTPRFIAAIVIIALGAIFTILLLFGQCFHFCSNRKIMKWVKNPKYNAFIEAYHAPFTPKHRYWVGLLLLIRIFHYLISAFTSETATILSVGCVVFLLLLLKLLNTRIYKLWSLDSLESSFLVNLGMLTIATYFTISTNPDNQYVVPSISMAIALITFIGIICYHFYEYLLKNTKLWLKLTKKIKLVEQIERFKSKRSKEGQPPEPTQTVENEYSFREPALELSAVYTNGLSEPPTPPSPKPPVITYTVIDGRPGRKAIPDTTQDSLN